MYNSFFGFKERPFQLVPNPAYLFLSRGHEDAMAHLLYAISQGDGFVEITGEVGTGKTTLCRAVLENLDKFTEAAYIFNPKLDSLQMLKAIHDEFGIPSDSDNVKDLIDTINVFLMKKKAEGKKVVVIVDEAQNLHKDVLEQLRLLSNLETTTSKLLQIVLVGQPELSEMLDSRELRQLGQRISLSCHLVPLTYEETREYIHHRIQVASQKQPEVELTRGACRAVYRYSGGIPRLINIACDRALLTAFGLNRKKITGTIAKASIREVAGRGDSRRVGLLEGRKVPASLGVLIGVVAVLYLATIFLIIHRSVDTRISTILDGTGSETGKVTQKVDGGANDGAGSSSVQASPPPTQADGTLRPASEKEMVEKLETIGSQKEQSGAGESLVLHAEDPYDLLKSVDGRSSRSDALSGVLDLWHGKLEISASLNDMEDDQAFFRIAARQNGLQILRITAGPDLLRKLNLPAVLELRLPGSPSPKYSALVRIREEAFVFRDPELGYVHWDYSKLKPYWSGAAYIPWKDFLGYDRIIQYGSPSDAVVSLKTFLRDLGYEGIEIEPAYDERTMLVVRGIQAKHGISADGLVGPFTKVVLYNEHRSLNIPHLVENQ
jgi:general secretion pathway protein A